MKKCMIILMDKLNKIFCFCKRLLFVYWFHKCKIKFPAALCWMHKKPLKHNVLTASTILILITDKEYFIPKAMSCRVLVQLGNAIFSTYFARWKRILITFWENSWGHDRDTQGVYSKHVSALINATSFLHSWCLCAYIYRHHPKS